MQEPGQVERVWWPRLRWRMRGAWQWPTYAALTVVDGVLLRELPFWGDGRGGRLVGAILFAAFVNLLAVAVVGPLAAVRLRRRRRDLPRVVARDYAGTAALGAVTLAFLAGGLVHRSAIVQERERLAAVAATTHDYVLARAPRYRDGLGSIDALRLEEDHYRACVPGADARRWMCLFVSTDQSPPGVTEDTSREPNTALRTPGGFR